MATFSKNLTVKPINMKKTSITEFIGTRKELLLTELPTYRDILRYTVLLREQSNKNSIFLIRDMAKQVANRVITNWQKANANFKAPIINSDKTIVEKIIKACKVASLISMNKKNKENKDKFTLWINCLIF